MAPEIPTNIMLGFRQPGKWLLSPTLFQLEQLGGSHTVIAFGLCDWDHPTDSPTTPLLPHIGAPDISLLPAELQAIRGSAQHDRTPGPFVRAFGEKLGDVVSPSDPETPQMLVFAALGDLVHIAPFLCEWKRQRMPALAISLVVLWPEPGHEDAQARHGVTLLQELHHDGIIDLAYAIHPRSPLVRLVGEDAQLHAVANVMAALQVAHHADEHNKQLAEVSRSIGHRGPVAGLALASAGIALGRRHWASRSPLRRWLQPDLGYGDPSDCYNVITARAARLLDDETARTMAAPFDLAAPPYELVVLVPFHSTDPRFPKLVGDLRHWAAATVPLAGTPTIVGGSGRIALAANGRYACLVAWVFGVRETDVHLHLPDADRGESERQTVP